VDDLCAAMAGHGVQPRTLIAIVRRDDRCAIAWPTGSRHVETAASDVVRELAPLEPRWVWWNARVTSAPLVDAGVRVDTCWDLGAVGMMVDGIRRDDPAAVWAAAHGLPQPRRHGETLDLFDVDHSDDGAVRRDGQLNPEWIAGGWADSPDRSRAWAELAVQLAERQRAVVDAFDDPRGPTDGAPLRVLMAYAESAATQLTVELEHDGLPIDRTTAGRLLEAAIGERPRDAAQEADLRAQRAADVLREFPGEPQVDLRSPEQVKGLLATIGLDLPDTRSWRLEPHAATSRAVAALLAWRKADRLETTYGWRWLDAHVGPDDRLRGRWYVADGGAGRMTAGAGLHNLPAELRPAVRAEPGHVLVRADLGQIEPRVLATVSGDQALIAATHEIDMYAPVAARIGCDRPTAKVAVLAAMYGQTSGAAGEALRGMDRAYPEAMAFLRDAEMCGRERRDVRTYGGRLIRFSADGGATEDTADPTMVAARGRYGRNAVIQGAAAELFKAWAATVRHAGVALDARIVLCLHDELVLHVPADRVEDATAMLHGALEATARWWTGRSGVRLVADVGTGSSWADAH
jgi:DNA polymerase-1